MTTQISLLPLMTVAVSASQDSDLSVVIGFQNGGVAVPLAGIGLALTIRDTLGTPYTLNASISDYLSSGGPNGIVALLIPVLRWRRVPVGTYLADLVATADGQTVVIGVLTITQSAMGGCFVTGVSTTARNAASANSVGYIPGPGWNQYKGNYDAGATYVANDVVYSGVSTWIALEPSTGIAPTVGPHWNLVAPGVDPTALNTAVSSASSSASAAAGSASTAATQATNAGASASSAATSATNAGNSATAAAGSASASSAAASAAATSASSLTSGLAQFRSVFIGEHATDPSVDGNGNALVIGAEYFNTTENKIRVYGSSGWSDYDATAQTQASNAALSATNAATSASTASTQATNAANSATAAAGSASTASTAATNAGNSASAASASASTASTQATNAGNSATAAAGSASAASTSATNAGNNATAAAGSASTAGTQATNAGNSATAAANSASAAAASATAANGSAIRYDTAQTLTSAQKAQAWQNLSFPAPTTFTASASIPASALAADLRFGSAATVNATLTLPAASSVVTAGWSTGVVSQENNSYIATIAVPSGVALDGVTNGTLKMFGKQKASFYYDTDGWHTVWIDRKPTLALIDFGATPVATADVTLPVGFTAYDLDLLNVVAADTIAWRASLDGTTFPTSFNSYISYMNDAANAGGGGAGSATYGSLFVGGSGAFSSFKGNFYSGQSGKGAMNVGSYICHDGSNVYSGVSSGTCSTTGAAVKFRLFTTGGNNMTSGIFALRAIA